MRGYIIWAIYCLDYHCLTEFKNHFKEKKNGHKVCQHRLSALSTNGVIQCSSQCRNKKVCRPDWIYRHYSIRGRRETDKRNKKGLLQKSTRNLCCVKWKIDIASFLAVMQEKRLGSKDFVVMI